MITPTIYTKEDIEKIVDMKIQKALTYRVKPLEIKVDKLREQLHDLNKIVSNWQWMKKWEKF